MRIVLDESAVRDLEKIRAWIEHDNPALRAPSLPDCLRHSIFWQHSPTSGVWVVKQARANGQCHAFRTS